MTDLRAHFDGVAASDHRARRHQRSFHAQLARNLSRTVLEGDSVVEYGCGSGEVLFQLPAGPIVGVDFSPAFLTRAAASQPDDRCTLVLGDLSAGAVSGTFDHVLLDYLVGYLPDIQAALQYALANAHPRTRLHLHSLNSIWRPALDLAVLTGRVSRQPASAWLSDRDLANLLELAGWEVVRFESIQLWPWDTPLIAPIANRWLVRLPLVRHLGITLAFTARPRRPAPPPPGGVHATIVVPARNEAGNIRAAIERIPVLDGPTEVIFVEGHSRDDTWDVIQREIAAYQGPLLLRALRQPGKGKWDAVRTGFDDARGHVLIIQDADLTAPPEDLPKFYRAVIDGAAEFANGSRLVYPMEDRAMRFLNLLGNKFFAHALSWVLGQDVKDSLCGTKALLRTDYARLRRRIAVWGDFDPFGDFNLLFGAAALGLRIRDIPVRYRERTYGTTNISRFRHGAMLLRMTWFGLRHLRFARA